MSRYTAQELRVMARTALAARNASDPRWSVLCMLLADHLQLTCRQVEREIERLAA